MSARFLVLLLLAVPIAARAADEGVLADLPFLEEIPVFGKLEGRIGIDLGSEKRPLPLILNTAASESLMTPRYARALRVPVRDFRVSGPIRRSTRLGRDLEFYIDTGSSRRPGRSGLEVGLLGGNFLRPYIVEVDYQERRVRFLDPEVWQVSPEPAEPGERVVPMRLSSGFPEIEILLGSGSAWVVLDTGDPGDLAISEERAAALGIEIPSGAPIVERINLWATDRRARVPLAAVEIDGLPIHDVTVEVALRSDSAWRETNFAGTDQALLGNAFLRRFRVRFDYPHGRVGLLPVEPQTSP